jgi:hypothetical protein
MSTLELVGQIQFGSIHNTWSWIRPLSVYTEMNKKFCEELIAYLRYDPERIEINASNNSAMPPERVNGVIA